MTTETEDSLRKIIGLAVSDIRSLANLAEGLAGGLTPDNRNSVIVNVGKFRALANNYALFARSVSPAKDGAE